MHNQLRQANTSLRIHKDEAASVRQFQREANEAAEVGRRALEERDEMEKQRDNALAKFVLNPHV